MNWIFILFVAILVLSVGVFALSPTKVSAKSVAYSSRSINTSFFCSLSICSSNTYQNSTSYSTFSRKNIEIRDNHVQESTKGTTIIHTHPASVDENIQNSSNFQSDSFFQSHRSVQVHIEGNGTGSVSVITSQ